MKRLYVWSVHTLRSVLAATGVLAVLDRAAGRSRSGLWVRSLLAVYDADDMFRLGVPWWTFDAIDVVDDFLRTRPRARVLEWGSGASTLWLATRAAAVASIEHDAAWGGRMARELSARDLDNVHLLVVEPRRGPGGVTSAKPGFAGLDFTAYADAIDRVDGEFDLIVIDGRAREACLVRALDRLADGGLILFDNVDRARYRDAIEALGTRLHVTWTRGVTPSLPYPTRTAVIAVPRREVSA
ncbi:hypothetical protein GCM10009795_013780 [Nocardioides hankookensis]|uniref:Class I SAM-dependent methyltransferase n=1 Tax=Nocardioides hankookensis TaxID=443157 RepID=A0ABW1LJF1_9ACTN